VLAIEQGRTLRPVALSDGFGGWLNGGKNETD